MVVGAMIYPGIIGTMAVGTTIFLLTFVLPRFMVIFKGKEAALPAADQVAAGPVQLHGQLLVRPARRRWRRRSGASS